MMVVTVAFTSRSNLPTKATVSAQIVSFLARGFSCIACDRPKKAANSSVSLRLLGPDALVETEPWHTLFLTAPSLSIRGGTDEIQRNIIGERILGLAEEPRLDRTLPFDHLPR